MGWRSGEDSGYRVMVQVTVRVGNEIKELKSSE